MELAAVLILSGIGLLGWAALSGRRQSLVAELPGMPDATSEEASSRTVPFIPFLPGPDHRPDERFESVVAGVHLSNPDGTDRQAIVAGLSEGSGLCLVRDFGHERDDHAVAVFTDEGQMLGHLPGDVAPRIAAILDRKRPVTAAVIAIEPFGGRTHQGYLGLRLELTAHRKAKSRKSRKAAAPEVEANGGAPLAEAHFSQQSPE